MASERDEGKKRTSTKAEPASGAPSHEAVAKRAFEIHLLNGGKHGTDLQDWLRAERELLDGRDQDRE